ncbi:DNA-3-methyladenine glycosylase isoform X4 [Dendrobates tinctorius]|uniref:DNA-3-methyladenine glycosylase isoform X4 n=1 Tax=Dendrobates tinctorius TaxID=92724 RepID=UPI003CC9395A
MWKPNCIFHKGDPAALPFCEWARPACFFRESVCTRMPIKRRREQGTGDAENSEKKASGDQRENDSVSSKYFQSTKKRLVSDFYNKPCTHLAKSFLGQILVRRLPDGTELRGRIVETESYLGGEDEASHSRGGKRTERNVAMYMKPGTIYVYQIYGMYFCMNVSSQDLPCN